MGSFSLVCRVYRVHTGLCLYIQQENDYHNTPYYSRLKEKCLRITNIIWLYGYTYDVYFLAAVEAIIYTLVFFLVTKKKL